MVVATLSYSSSLAARYVWTCCRGVWTRGSGVAGARSWMDGSWMSQPGLVGQLIEHCGDSRLGRFAQREVELAKARGGVS